MIRTKRLDEPCPVPYRTMYPGHASRTDFGRCHSGMVDLSFLRPRPASWPEPEDGQDDIESPDET